MFFLKFTFQDWAANKGNAKARFILALFRTANFSAERPSYKYILLPFRIIYKVIVEFILSVEIPWNVKIGKGLVLYHGQALVLSSDVVIGNNCTLRQSTTIGNKQLKDGSVSKGPCLGNWVDVGSNVCIIGPIDIGDNVKIGAGTVVVKDVYSNSVVVGNPAVIIKTSSEAAADLLNNFNL